jgi:hypothetical protein
MARRQASEGRLLMGLLIGGGLVVVLIVAALVISQLPH